MTHHDQLRTPRGRRLLAALRKTCDALPEVEEAIDGFGHTSFRVRRKSFIIAGMGEMGESISIKSDPITQAALIRRGPYYRTPYIGQHGWISVDNPLGRDWAEIEELILDGYRLAAPRRLAKLLPPES